MPALVLVASSLLTAINHVQAEYIKPFFKILKNRVYICLIRNYLSKQQRFIIMQTVNADILADVGKIVDLAMAREYVKANDWYLRMSIGTSCLFV